RHVGRRAPRRLRGAPRARPAAVPARALAHLDAGPADGAARAARAGAARRHRRPARRRLQHAREPGLGTTLQHLVPRAVLSRVTAYDWFGSMACQPIGLAIAGPLAVAIGTGTTLWLTA